MNKLAKSNNKEDSQATGECSSPISFNSMSTHRLSIKIPHVFMMYSNNCMNVWNIRKLSIIENRVYYILDQLVCRCLFLRYIQNPSYILSLKGKSLMSAPFCWLPALRPFMVFFRHGYVWLTCNLYDPKSSDPSTHLTNQVQLKLSDMNNRGPTDSDLFTLYKQ